MLATALHFNGDMHKFYVLAEHLPISLRRFRIVPSDANNGGKLARSDLPDVEIGDARVAVTLHRPAYLVWQIG